MTHLREFLSDAGPIVEKLKTQVGLCLREQPGESLLDEVFRHLHSLKSGAAFFQLNEAEEHIHAMESLFGEMKDSSGEEPFFEKARQLHRSIPLLESLLQGTRIEEGPFQEDEEPIEISLVGGAGERERIELSPFQRQLLREAERREDELFCLTVQLDPDERLPYVRAYLILNNLEVRTNLIYSQPTPDTPDQDYSALTFLLTSPDGETPVFEAVNVDGILQTGLARMDYSHFSSSERKGGVQAEVMVRETLAPVMSKVELETDTVARLKDSLMEMKETVLPLGKDVPEREALLGLIKEMEQDLSSVSLIPLSSLYPNLKRFAAESGERLEKKIACDFRGGRFGLSIRSLELVSRVLIQLIRNAVSHGIELPSSRLEAGKNPVGTIALDARMEEGRIRLRFEDDGKGVDLDAVAATAGLSREEVARPENLLRILTRPGFSTSSRVDSLSGRGIGLDLISHDVENALGGTLGMESLPGKGTIFSLTLPGEQDTIPIMIFQMEDRMMALPKRNVAGIFPMEEERIERKEHNLLSYRTDRGSLPLYNLQGKISRRNPRLTAPYAMVVQHLGRKAVMPVDDLILERDILRDRFFLGEQKEPFLYEVALTNEEVDFMYLSPALIG